MKASELRIGNWIKGSENFIATSSHINIAELRERKLNTHSGFDPIPLTEEWLLKFGFAKEETKESERHGFYFSKSYIDINYCFSFADFREDFGLYIEYTDSPHESDEGKKYPVSFGVKYVHQLQNLYFALTGGELKTDKS